MKITCETGVTTKSHTQTSIEQAEGRFAAAIICLGVNDVTYDVNLRAWLKKQLFMMFKKSVWSTRNLFFRVNLN